jgi:hypothetical protein
MPIVTILGIIHDEGGAGGTGWRENTIDTHTTPDPCLVSVPHDDIHRRHVAIVQTQI